MENRTDASSCVGGAIVVVAKCPVAGTSKTRLVPMLGEEGAASLARAMLMDVLSSLSECPPLGRTLKVLIYAPGTVSGGSQMSSILRSLGIPYVNPHPPSSPPPDDDGSSGRSILPLPVLRTVLANNGWVLLPARSSSSSSSSSSSAAARSDDDLLASSSFLGDVLADALDRTRELLDMARRSSPTPTTAVVDNGAVLFLGMDSPELPMEEVVHGLRISSGRGGSPPPPRKNGDDAPGDDDEINGTNGHRDDERETFAGKAHLCPANDGGYGLLSVPKHAPSSGIFSGVRWSQPLAAISQLKALTDCDVNVSIGRLMFDVDEPDDVRNLVARLMIRHRDDRGGGGGYDDEPPPPRGGGGDSLTMSSSGIDPAVSSTGVRKSFPHHTWRMMTDLNVVEKE